MGSDKVKEGLKTFGTFLWKIPVSIFAIFGIVIIAVIKLIRLNLLIEWLVMKVKLSDEDTTQKRFKLFLFDQSKERNAVGKYLHDNWFGETYQAQNKRVFIFFLLPSLSCFVLFVIIPFIQGMWLSLTDYNGISVGSEDFVGFDNYKEIFSDFSYYFSFYRTIIYAILNVVMINVVAFTLALFVTQKLMLKNLYRAAFFMPNLIGGLVLGYIWQFIYNKALVQVAPMFDPSLISQGDTALWGLIVVVTWQYAGYIMMIYIAALQNVPQDLVEASKIDGANAVQRLRHIVFPLIAQAFTIAMFLTLTTSFKQFDTVVSLTQGGPSLILENLPLWVRSMFNITISPIVQSTQLVASDIYETAFTNRLQGVGQAKAIVFFFVLLLVSFVQVRINQKREVEL